MTLPFETYLDAGAEELERVLDVLEAADGSATVPTCPGWTATDLAGHLRDVYARWRGRLAGGDGRTPDATVTGPSGQGSVATRSEVVEACYAEGTALLAELAAAGPEAACWNWTDADQHAGWLARRIALETAVHRVDAELTARSAHPVERELAADGITERLEAHVGREVAGDPRATLGGTLCLICSDLDAAHVIELTGGRLRWRLGRGPADAAVVGTASELFLFSWNRLALDRLSLTGRPEVAAAWADLPGRPRR